MFISRSICLKQTHVKPAVYLNISNSVFLFLTIVIFMLDVHDILSDEPHTYFLNTSTASFWTTESISYFSNLVTCLPLPRYLSYFPHRSPSSSIASFIKPLTTSPSHELSWIPWPPDTAYIMSFIVAFLFKSYIVEPVTYVSYPLNSVFLNLQWGEISGEPDVIQISRLGSMNMSF